jgi:hypothetical protein
MVKLEAASGKALWCDLKELVLIVQFMDSYGVEQLVLRFKSGNKALVRDTPTNRALLMPIELD